MEAQTTIGKTRRTGVNLVELKGQGPSLFYSQCETAEEANGKPDHIKPFMKGDTLAGVFLGIRYTKEDKKAYLALEDVDSKAVYGIFAPRQLENRASTLPVGNYLEVTYNGRIPNPTGENREPMHDFSIKHGTLS